MDSACTIAANKKETYGPGASCSFGYYAEFSATAPDPEDLPMAGVYSYNYLKGSDCMSSNAKWYSASWTAAGCRTYDSTYSQLTECGTDGTFDYAGIAGFNKAECPDEPRLVF